MRNFVGAVLALMVVGASAQARDREHKEAKPAAPAWLGAELPLPLAVKTPQDLRFKEVVEREYLVFNLLAGGKVAWDAGRFGEAAQKWETLLAVPGLDPAIDHVVRPLAIEARRSAGQVSKLSPEGPASTESAHEGQQRLREAEAKPPAETKEPAPPPKPKFVDVTGTVGGGGDLGPGGAVVVLRRADGHTPRPSSSGDFVVFQRGKKFVPHVVAVPVGATVAFKNQDPIFHDVFSLTTPNDFDLGLYKSGLSRTKTFTSPGAAQLFCNIHAAMSAWVYVSDSPWYAVADASGRFTVRHVPPGDYQVEVWHERSSKPTKGSAEVTPGMAPLSFTVGGDRRPPAFPPDKYGHQRQVQLGY